MRPRRVPGHQHGIGVEVTATGPGYRLRVVDGTPHSAEHPHPDYTAGRHEVPARGVAGPNGAAPRASRMASWPTLSPVLSHSILHSPTSLGCMTICSAARTILPPTGPS